MSFLLAAIAGRSFAALRQTCAACCYSRWSFVIFLFLGIIPAPFLSLVSLISLVSPMIMFMVAQYFYSTHDILGVLLVIH
jgi:hypothetical protein